MIGYKPKFPYAFTHLLYIPLEILAINNGLIHIIEERNMNSIAEGASNGFARHTTFCH